MDPTVMDAKTVVKMATIEGARVLGLDEQIGSIEVGKWADIIILDMMKPHWIPLFNPYSQLVYAASGADVTTSIIGGRVVMRNRELLSIDLPAVAREVKTIADAIAESIVSQSS
jgi:5-methylthioadenosine/S-adenosylhomocysteine deaminase